MDYKSLGKRAEKTNQKIPWMNAVKNDEGGYSFLNDKWYLLTKFLILGTASNTFYSDSCKLTQEAFENIKECIKEDGVRVVQETLEVSLSGRNVHSDTCLFVLALCLDSKLSNKSTVQFAKNSINSIVRTGSHLFRFVDIVSSYRGWGRALKNGVANWYTSKNVDDLAYQVVKYQQRYGYSHRDLLRLSHPVSEEHNELFKYILKKDDVQIENLPSIIQAFEAIKDENRDESPLYLIEKYRMPREAIPTQMLKISEVWESMLKVGMPMGALIRNINAMSRIPGLIEDFGSQAYKYLIDSLNNESALRRSRVHPIEILKAYVTIQNTFHSRTRDFDTRKNILDALNKAFFKSLGNIEPSGKSIFIAVDVSGSMSFDQNKQLGNIQTSALAMMLAYIHVATERYVYTTKFNNQTSKLDISRYNSIDQIIEYARQVCHGSTDVASPINYAVENNIRADGIIIYTDHQTYAGNNYPEQAYREYLRKVNSNAKLAYVSMAYNKYQSHISNPLAMDFIGVDTSTPIAITEFLKM